MDNDKEIVKVYVLFWNNRFFISDDVEVVVEVIDFEFLDK